MKTRILLITFLFCVTIYFLPAPAIELTHNDTCIRTMTGDFAGDGIKETVTLKQKNNKELKYMVDYDLEIIYQGKTFLIKDVLTGESEYIRGLEKITVSSKINPFIGISYYCGAHSWGLDLYAFNGQKIKKITNIGSDVPSIQLKDVDNDGDNEIVVAERDWGSGYPVENRIIDTFKYNGKEWKLISKYETRTKKFIPVNKKIINAKP